jgi:hypothetical protein
MMIGADMWGWTVSVSMGSMIYSTDSMERPRNSEIDELSVD